MQNDPEPFANGSQAKAVEKGQNAEKLKNRHLSIISAEAPVHGSLVKKLSLYNSKWCRLRGRKAAVHTSMFTF
jgi:hypothetical protein